jgi:hypothetical protein
MFWGERERRLTLRSVAPEFCYVSKLLYSSKGSIVRKTNAVVLRCCGAGGGRRKEFQENTVKS